jgi:hypothetical protein
MFFCLQLSGIRHAGQEKYLVDCYRGKALKPMGKYGISKLCRKKITLKRKNRFFACFF